MLAYYTTRMLGRGMGRTQGYRGMEILDQMTVGRDSYLLVVKVQEKIFLIGVSPGLISKLENWNPTIRRGDRGGAGFCFRSVIPYEGAQARDEEDRIKKAGEERIMSKILRRQDLKARRPGPHLPGCGRRAH